MLATAFRGYHAFNKKPGYYIVISKVVKWLLWCQSFLLHSTVVKGPYILLLKVTMYSYNWYAQNRKTHSDGFIPSTLNLLSQEKYGSWYSCDWLLCNQGCSSMLMRLKVTMYSYFKWYAKNGSHILTAC